MKKLLLILIVQSICYTTFAQQETNRVNVIQLMEEYFIEQGYSTIGTICVVNELNHKWTCHDIDVFINGYDVAIFAFYIMGGEQFSAILLKSGGNYEILPLSSTIRGENDARYMEFFLVLNKLTDYFTRHPEVDHRLMPYYIKSVAGVYLSNTKIECYGLWNEWHATDYDKCLKMPEKYKYGIDLDEK